MAGSRIMVAKRAIESRTMISNLPAAAELVVGCGDRPSEANGPT